MAERESRTFGELEDRQQPALAACSRRAAFRMGDRLCVHLANCVEMIELFLACVKLGVIFVPINILYREREIEHIVRDAEPKLSSGPGEMAELAQAVG